MRCFEVVSIICGNICVHLLACTSCVHIICARRLCTLSLDGVGLSVVITVLTLAGVGLSVVITVLKVMRLVIITWNYC